MKKLYFLLLFMVCAGYAQQQPFVTTWEVPASEPYIFVPVYGNDNNYTIDFGDGIILNNQSGEISHYYNSPGTYTVSISGNFNRIYFNDIYISYRIKTIEQWGSTVWSSMESAFKGCSSLVINATDIANLSQVTNMSHMFKILL